MQVAFGRENIGSLAGFELLPALRRFDFEADAAFLDRLRGLPETGEPRIEAGALLLPCAAPKERIPELLRAVLDRGVPVTGLQEVKTDLEDLFMKLTRGDVA